MRKAVSSLVGRGGTSKSQLAVAQSLALALGQAIGRFRPRKAYRVLLLNSEDDDQEQQRRISSQLRILGRKSEDLADRLGRVSVKSSAPLIGMSEEGHIAELAPMAELRRLIKHFEPDVVVVDPLVDLHSASENDNVEMRQVMSLLRALAIDFNVAVLVVHHSGKGQAAPGDADAARGASSIVNLARICLTVSAMNEDEAKSLSIPPDRRNRFFRLDGAKANYTALAETEWFERVVHRLANGDDVAAVSPWAPPVDVITSEKRVAIEAGIAEGSPDGPWSPKLSNDPRSFRQLCLTNGVRTAEGQRQLLRQLEAAGYIVTTFRKASNRSLAQGLKTPNGQPRADWHEQTLE